MDNQNIALSFAFSPHVKERKAFSYIPALLKVIAFQELLTLVFVLFLLQVDRIVLTIPDSESVGQHHSKKCLPNILVSLGVSS